eukprot:jgi/Undpi1/8833/HiC_scaffold_25.g11295.m1
MDPSNDILEPQWLVQVDKPRGYSFNLKQKGKEDKRKKEWVSPFARSRKKKEPEGPAAPRTPGRWKSLWASDCARLEEAHRKGQAEVLVYGRKYVVDMKERTVRALYWKEAPAKKAVMRATYFVRKGGGWIPYNEEDSETLENSYGSAIVQLRGEKCTAVDVPLSDGVSKVWGNSGSTRDLQQLIFLPVKAPSMLTTTFTKTTFEVHRGTPEKRKEGWTSISEGDMPHEGKPPKHLMFVGHGCEVRLGAEWSKNSSALTSLRNTMKPMRDMSAEFLQSQRRADQTSEEPVGEAKELDKGEAMEAGVPEGGGGDTEVGSEHVEFLPVEWYEQVHGAGIMSDRLVQDVTLDSIPSFRGFANQVFMDIMYYLTPSAQGRILKAVVEEMNRMWTTFSKYTPEFSGKVSVVGHSLGSIIVHDVLIAQPARGQPGPARVRGGAEIPILGFDPEVMLMCGSPLGMFLSLPDSALDTDSLFNFKTTKRFFNLFHFFDPVAYRLEPLIDRRLRDLQPEHVPHRGGDRIHVTVQKFKGDVDAAFDKVSKTTGAGFMAIQRTLTTTLKSVTGDTAGLGAEDVASEGEVIDAREKLKERIDWSLQESPLEGMHPWASAVFAHSSYFQSMDMIMFLVNALDENPAPENADIGELAPKKTEA